MFTEANFGTKAKICVLSFLSILSFNLIAQDEPTPLWKKKMATWKESELTCMEKAAEDFKTAKIHGEEIASTALADFKAKPTDGQAILERIMLNFKYLNISEESEDHKHPMYKLAEKSLATYKTTLNQTKVFDDLLADMKKYKENGMDVSEGCFQRASALYDYITAKCPTTAPKLYFKWIFGDLELNKNVTWRYHTAVAFTDKNQFIWILDPTYSTKVVVHKNWHERYNPSKGTLKYDSTLAKELSPFGSQDAFPTDPKPKKIGYYNPNPGKSLQQSYSSSYYASAASMRPSAQQSKNL